MTKQNTTVPRNALRPSPNSPASALSVRRSVGDEARISGKNRAVTKPEP